MIVLKHLGVSISVTNNNSRQVLLPCSGSSDPPHTLHTPAGQGDCITPPHTPILQQGRETVSLHPIHLYSSWAGRLYHSTPYTHTPAGQGDYITPPHTPILQQGRKTISLHPIHLYSSRAGRLSVQSPLVGRAQGGSTYLRSLVIMYSLGAGFKICWTWKDTTIEKRTLPGSVCTNSYCRRLWFDSNSALLIELATVTHTYWRPALFGPNICTLIAILEYRNGCRAHWTCTSILDPFISVLTKFLHKHLLSKNCTSLYTKLVVHFVKNFMKLLCPEFLWHNNYF